MENNNITPNYFAKKNLYPSTVELRQELGMQDSYIHLQELGTRVLLEEIDKAGGCPADYLPAKFKAHGLSNGTLDVESLSVFAAQSYIAQTYTILEKYLKSLSREYRNHKWIAQTEWDKGDSEKKSPYVRLLDNLHGSERSLLVSKPESKLFEYYRTVRVAASHKNEETVKKVDAEFLKFTSEDRQHFRSAYALDAPNRYGELTYDDYFLFTRAIKYFSNLINDACDLQCQDIIDFIRHGDSDVLELLSPVIAKTQEGEMEKTGSPKGYNPIKRIASHAHTVYGTKWNTRGPIDNHDLRFVKQRKEILEVVGRLDKNAPSHLYYRVETDRVGDFTIRVFEKSKEKKPDTEKENFAGNFEEASRWLYNKEKGS